MEKRTTIKRGNYANVTSRRPVFSSNWRQDRTVPTVQSVMQKAEHSAETALKSAEELTTKDLASLADHLKRMLATAGQSWAFGEHDGLLKRHFSSVILSVSRKIPLTKQLTRSLRFAHAPVEMTRKAYALSVRRLHPNFAALFAAVLVFSLLAPLYHGNAAAAGYDLSKAESLLSTPSKDIQSKLVYDSAHQSYDFNVANPTSELAGQTANSNSLGGISYSAQLPEDLTTQNSIDLTDASSGVKVSLTPQFLVGQGKQQGGHVVYPLLDQNGQLVYTPGGNGLKEDILLYSSPGTAAQFTYKLNLPNGFTATQTPDGSILITGKDPNSGQSLTYSIPAPVVKGSKGVKAMFKLSGSTLTVWALGLDKANYPLSIDPTFVMSTSNCGWGTGNTDTANVSFSSCQVSRGRLTGGGLNSANNGSWTSATSLPAGTEFAASATYNGYIYEIGGCSGSACPAGVVTSVYYAPINSDSSLGSWNSTTSLPTATYGATSVAYNGYIYEIGGCTTASSCTPTANVYYAAINSDGTVGSWTATSSLSVVKAEASSVVYNGYVYAIGGCNTTGACSPTSTVYYAAINANGTLGSWTATSSLAINSKLATAEVYNGYVYEIGGCTGTSCPTGVVANVYYALINASGTLGSWTATTSMSVPIYEAGSVVYNGYVYVISGCSTSCSTSNSYYAPVNANGTLGNWSVASPPPFAPTNATSVAYNGYIYEIGGEAAGPTSNTYYVAIDPAGSIGQFATTTSLPAAAGNSYSAAVVYNGYVYEIGGTTSNNFTTAVYYAPINSNGTLGSWNPTTSLPVAVEGATAVVSGGYIYSMGGQTSSSYTAAVYYASINSNGTLGAWTATTSLPDATFFASSTTYNGYVYELGGIGNGTAVYYSFINTNGTLGAWTAASSLPASMITVSSASAAYGGYLYMFGPGTGVVDYAAINTNGSLGSWTSTTSLPVNFDNPAPVVYNDCIYIYTGSGVYYFAPINTNGTVGSWTETNGTWTLPSSGSNPTTVTYGGNIYVMGGSRSGGDNTAVYYARINNNGPGSVGSWTATSSLPAASFYISSVTYNGYVYKIGGRVGSSSVATVYYAAINANGTLGSWNSTTSLSSATESATSVAYNGYVYIIGGANTGGSLTTVYYAQINANGTLGSWNSTTSLPVANQNAISVVYNGYVYEMSGNNTTSYYAQINANGTLGSWNSTTSLPVANQQATTAVYNGYVYEIGGASGGGVAAVYYAPINANGTLGSWTATTSLPVAIYGATSVAYNGYLYEIGGGFVNVYYAPINANGTLGSWTATTSLTNATSIAGSVVYNGYVYEIGGFGSSGGIANVYYAPLSSMSQGARYSILVSLYKNVNPADYYMTATPESSNSNLSIAYETATLASGVLGTSTSTGGIASGTKYPISLAANTDGVAYYWLTITIDDSQSATFGGETPTSISYFQLNYHAHPSMRLRGGMTFTSGSLQGLDTP